jgi:phytoene synthase
MASELDSQVREHDEDRWLASRFAPADARSRLIAIYAVNEEIARTPEVVTQAALGDIRLAWWREAIEEVERGGQARAHPALQAYARATQSMSIPSGVFERLIAARAKDFDAAPFADWSNLEDYLDATAGGVIRLAIAACGQQADEGIVRAAAQAWGCVGLLRAEGYWRARGRSWAPRQAGGAADLKQRAHAAIADVHGRSFAAAVFPALGYVALAAMYLRALERGGSEPLLLQRQFKLIAAAATGRV